MYPRTARLRPTVPVRSFALSALLLFGSTGLVAQDVTLSSGTPSEVGLSQAILDAGVQLYRNAVDNGDLVGAVLLVAKDGKVVLHEAMGWRNKAKDLPMLKNTMFRMASNTKPTIATSVGILVEEGKLDYDAPVRTYMPSFDNYRSGFIQVRHLLNHTSGFRIGTLFLEPYMKPSAEHPDAPNLKLEAARYGEVGAEVLPGTSYSYSNPGFNTLGALVEIASEQSLESFLDQRIYTPLGMEDSYNHELPEKLDGKLDRMGAIYYERDASGQWVPGWEPGDAPQVPFVRASGGMISTAWDYAKFCQMFLNGGVYGGARILKESTVRRMTSDTYLAGGEHEPERGVRVGYGFGWVVDPDPTFSHTGSDGTAAWVDPNENLIVLVFTQTPRGRNPRGKFLELVRSSTGS
ncbi:MAG TPA: serine hydrolase domain-containing protein [Longimicrobiales bacterium]|nr:serine hydrolase domain-containing protein [Longimicrobiales bacterium]